ncbi:DUF805 domain-containing protein [Pseudomonas huanghezhanensis]|uniref:DUF805 domain-containing protein n=1 Tax=Pseudomonas huanghezhanensis TaxID=3002903 RepID=UPI00228572A5|nr:DUF805 domain-containing protein [Pseudomonas sp. BSw22131]
MAEHFKIVFEGELREGVEPQTAKLNLAQLFKSDVAAIDRLFYGRPVTVKRGLTHEEAERYLGALNGAGVQARIESEAPIALTLEEIEEPAVEQPRFESSTSSPYAPPRAAPASDWTGVGELNVFTVQGRIGRLRYLAWSMVLMLVALVVGALCMTIMNMSLIAGGLLGSIAVVALIVISIQIGAQRLHDAGWSAWLLLLNLVPFVGSFFPFLMMVVPGNNGANQYGAPQPPNSRSVKILASLWLVVIAITFLGVLMGGVQTFKDEVEITTSEYEQALPYDEDSDSDASQPADPSSSAESSDDDR